MEFQAEIIRTIQSAATPALDMIFEGITMLGEDFFIIFVATLIYWCFSKEIGYWICWCLSFGNVFINTVKCIFRIDRPIGYEGIRTLREHTAPGYSFPSGHTHASSNFFFSAAKAFNKKWFWGIAIVIPAFVGLSRLYLGVHWPMDVVCGYIIGLLIPLLLWKIYKKFSERKAFLFIISTLIYVPFFFVCGDDKSFWKSFGFALGVAIGALIEQKFIKFETKGITIKQKVFRYLGGIAVVLIVYLGMKVICPEGHFFSFIRYFCIPLAATAAWPAVFKKFGF